MARSLVLIPFLVSFSTSALAFEDSSDTNSSADSSNDSGQSSDNSDASSQNSNDSSQNSNDSSNDSNNSSQNSDDSSDESWEQSSRDSSDGTSEQSSGSSRNGGGEVLTAVAAVLIIGGAAVGTGFAIWSSVRDDAEEPEENAAQQELAHRVLRRNIRRNHPQLVREVTLGRGPLLTSWLADLGLSADERTRFARSLEGSAQQTRLLKALDGPVDRSITQGFASSFCEVLRRAVGERRWVALAPPSVRARR